MAAHTVTIKQVEVFDPDVPTASPLGVETTRKLGDPIVRVIIDVDDTVQDHWHFYAPEAIATRMKIYGLDNEVQAVEALARELVRGWDPIEHPADVEEKVRYGGVDVGIEVVWATGIGKQADDVIATFRERIERMREMQQPAVEASA